MNPKPSVCLEIEADLLASATGEAEPAAVRRVQGHVDRCGPCRQDFERYRAIDDVVADLREAALPAAPAAAARERLSGRLADLRRRLLIYRVFPSPFGRILIARSEEGVLLVEYLSGGTTVKGSRLARLAGVETVEDGAEIEALYRDLRAYLDGRLTELPWPLDLRLARSDFHRDVLRATAAIPYGAVISYAGLARQVGRPQAVRAAAQALRWNPLPIVIPCHRVIGTSGALTGYAGGETTRKQKLLAVEGVPTVKARRDHHIAREAMYVRLPGEPEYCLPTCPSVTPAHVAGCFLFGSRERAEAAGFAPCTTCRPDLHPITP